MELDGLFVDMYGTLTTGDRAAVEACCAAIVADSRLRLSAYELSITWGERFFAAMERANGGRFETLAAIEGRTLCETMAALGVAVEPGPYVARLVEYWRNPPLQPDTREFLASVGKPVCIVSNADRADIEAAIARHGIRVAGVMTSEQARSYKPDPELFEAALRLTGWRRERVLHVGDSLHSDVGGARRAGLISGWVNRAHRIHDIGNHEPDHEFADLHELQCWLDAS
jgi:2-haloacid dehalogenase/putative hydrolase of the HAD superfamily